MRYRERRKITSFPAEIIAEGEAYAISIEQFSRSGMRVSSMPNWTKFSIDREDQAIELQVLDQRFPVRVRWQHEDQAGLQVLVPVPKEILDRVDRR